MTKYKEESQSKLVEWLKDGGLLENAGDNLEKVKQQIKRRKMTLKRKQSRAARCSQGEDSEDSDELEAEDDDPLYNAKINLLQDDSFISLNGPPVNRHADADSPRHDIQGLSEDDECMSPAEFPFSMESNYFPDSGPYSPTTVIIEDYSPSFSFHSMYDATGPLLDTYDLFPRTSYVYPLSHRSAIHDDKHLEFQALTTDPSGSYYQAEV